MTKLFKIKSWSLLHLFLSKWLYITQMFLLSEIVLLMSYSVLRAAYCVLFSTSLSLVQVPWSRRASGGRAAVAQRAAPAAHRRVRRVKVLRTLNALMVISTAVQPAVAVLSLGIRYPQIPCQIPQDQAIQQAHHTGEMRLNPVPLKHSAPDKLPVFGLSER